MVPVPIAGNILDEATTSSGNTFNDAMRGASAPFPEERGRYLVLVSVRRLPAGGVIRAPCPKTRSAGRPNRWTNSARNDKGIQQRYCRPEVMLA